MLGYATDPDDLALGRMQDELRTGDLARIDTDGLVRIVGRRTDFVKIMGIRIDLGMVERQLRGGGGPRLCHRRGGPDPGHLLRPPESCRRAGYAS